MQPFFSIISFPVFIFSFGMVFVTLFQLRHAIKSSDVKAKKSALRRLFISLLFAMVGFGICVNGMTGIGR